MEDELIMINGLGALEMEEEIGRVSRKFPRLTQAAAAAMAAQKLTNRSLRLNMLTDAQKTIMINSKDLSVDAQQAVRDGKGRYRETDLYIRAVVSGGSGGQELLKTSTVEKVGITNINQAKLTPGVNASIDRVGVFFAKSATVTDPAGVRYSNTDATTDAPILNGEIQVLVGDRPQFRLPLSRFFNLGGTYASVPGNFNVVKLQRPFLIPEGVTIRIVVTLPDGSVLPTANNFLEVRLMGTELVTN
jgi:hypothetical protein